MNEESEYEVGYGKPPKEHQFPKGKSGNLLGRPKKRKTTKDLVEAALNEEVMVNGKKLIKHELMILSIVNDAIKGNSSARKLILSRMSNEELLEEFEPTGDDKIAYLKLASKFEQRTEDVEEDEYDVL